MKRLPGIPSRTLSHAREVRARIILALDEGASGTEVAERPGLTRATASRRRGRFAAPGIKRWLPDRQLVVTTDSGYSALEFLAAVSDERLSVVTRLRIDAALTEPAPERRVGQRGRPRKKGHSTARLRRFEAYLDELHRVLGDQRRHEHVDACCRGLNLGLERKSADRRGDRAAQRLGPSSEPVALRGRGPVVGPGAT